MGILLTHTLRMRKLRHGEGRTPVPSHTGRVRAGTGVLVRREAAPCPSRVTVVRAELAWEELCPASHQPGAGVRAPFLLCPVLLQRLTLDA